MKDFVSSIMKVWKIFRPFKKQLAVILTLQGILQALILASPFILGKALNIMQTQGPFRMVIMLASLMLLLQLSQTVVQMRKDIYELRTIDFGINAHLTDKTLTQILSLSIGQHRSQNSGITQNVINQGQSSLESLMFLVLYSVIPISAEIIITLALLLWFNPLVGAIVLSGTMLYLWLAVVDTKIFWPKVKSQRDLAHKMNKSFGEIIKNTSLVQVNSQESRVQTEHGERVTTWSESGKRIWVSYQTKGLRRAALIVLLRYTVLMLGALLVYRKHFLFGDFIILWAWTQQATSQLYLVARIQRQTLDLWAQVKKYFAILDVTPAIIVASNPTRLRSISGRVEFKDVSFTYPNQRYIELENDEDSKIEEVVHPALTSISFIIEAGQCVAFVGESGAGKSTIINLLVRGYDPDHGQILIDSYDLRLVDLHDLRQSIGLVEQNVTLFDNTLRYNMNFGLNGRRALITDDDLEKVSVAACIDRFSHRLPKGWETWIGENGVKLSGGERQRVGIARALIKEPQILILDEATSSLDAVNESLVKEAVRNASVGRTTIIIAHRLSTVRDVDKIFVMDKGRVVAEGKHEDLLVSSEKYRELVEKQLFTV